jgi:hypothetical protein
MNTRYLSEARGLLLLTVDRCRKRIVEPDMIVMREDEHSDP